MRRFERTGNVIQTSSSNQYGCFSTRKISQVRKISHKSVHRVLRNKLSLHPYHISIHELQTTSLEFCTGDLDQLGKLEKVCRTTCRLMKFQKEKPSCICFCIFKFSTSRSLSRFEIQKQIQLGFSFWNFINWENVSNVFIGWPNKPT